MVQVLYCDNCEQDVETHIDEAGIVGVADTEPVYVCNECNETICDVAEVLEDE